MKAHTSEFKENISQIGKQLDSIITYEQNGNTIELGVEELNSVTPSFKGDILKSVMKQLDIDSNVEIPVGTEINYQFGVKTRSGKNLWNEDYTNISTGIKYKPIYVGDGTFTMSSNIPYNASGSSLFLLAGNVSTGASSSTNGVRDGLSRTQTSVNGYITIAYRGGGNFDDPQEYQTQLEQGTTATQYEPYGEFDYVNYGNYVVYKVEKQEDLNSYNIIAYDKMIYSMKDYESLGITYPITIRNYISALCTKIGLTFANSSDNFANYNRQIQNELYLDSQGNSMGYKFRDVLDELAQATGSTICINTNDELEVRYITQTNDTIDEDYFKDVNVNFGEKYGPINSIVLSRSGGADNVYLKDDQSIAQNGLCELKISDNQIMNGNDRADYLPDLLTKLGGLEYYLNDYSSPGITYYDLCDRYTVHIGDNYYSCVMFNDEILVTQGLEENIYTERPIQSETDYSKADKTDRKINQTYLIVDKQNQTIQSVVSNVGVQDEKISQITQTVNEINSKISDIADITTSAEDTDAVVELQEINTSEPIQIKIHPTGTNISYLYPSTNLYPSEDLYMKDRRIRFHNTTTDENFDFILPDDLLYYDSEHYDEFLLDYGDGTPQTQLCQVTKRCKYNADGTVSLLSQEEITNYTYPSIPLTDGDYEVSIYGYQQGYIFTRLMTKNIYTTQFYTKAETNTLINQTASEITTEANSKFTAVNGRIDENTARITQNSNAITSEVSRAQNSETTLSTRIAQNANAITSEVTDRQNSDSTLSTRIGQTAKSIALSVNNGSTSSGITITTTKEDGTTSTTTGNIQMNGLVSFTNLSTSGQTQINGDNLTTGVVKSQNYVANTSGTKIDLSNGVIDSKNFKVDSSGGVEMKNGKVTNGRIDVVDSSGNEIHIGTGYYGVTVNTSDNQNKIEIQPSGIFAEDGAYELNYSIGSTGYRIKDKNNKEKLYCGVTGAGSSEYGRIYVDDESGNRTINLNGYAGEITCVHVTQTSKEENKKDFEKLENALDIIKSTDIYKYHFKKQDSKEKKYIGFVIGDKYKYSKEITSKDNDGVDLYSMIGVCFKAIQEQQEEIEKLKEMIKNG